MNPLHEVFEYRDGGLYWKQPGKSRVVGKRFGRSRPDLYRQGMWNCKHYYEHRLIWEYFHGVSPKEKIDHIDGDPRNNLISNLREATNAENLANRGKTKNNTSGYKGVSWHKGNNSYVAYVEHKGKTTYRYAKDLEEARRIADELRNQLHGEFAKHE